MGQQRMARGKVSSAIGAIMLAGAVALTGIAPAHAEGVDEPDAQVTEQLDDVKQAESSEQSDTVEQPRDARVIQANVMANQLGLWGDSKNRRLSGSNRFTTAVAISKDAYPNPASVNTVVVTTGNDFPDSLSAAPLAAKLGGPLLMTTPTKLSEDTRAEIQRLKPTTIIVIGGKGAVSNGVEASLRALLPSGGKIERLGGADRYETSVKIAEYGRSGIESTVFFATGLDFPDALSAGAAAGAQGAPLILVPPTNQSIGPQTRAYLTSRKTTTIHIVGGTAGINDSLAADARKIGVVKTVQRHSGRDRFATAAAVADRFYTSADRAYLAYGMDFPDALTGAAVAGALGAPLLLSLDTCIPTVTYDAHDRLVPKDTIILGGTGALAGSVEHGNECMTKPNGASTASFTGMQQLYARINQARFDVGRTGFRLADSKVSHPAYNWAAGKKFSRNTSLAKQQPWVSTEAVAQAPVVANSQVGYIANMFIRDTKNGTRSAILRTYGGVRPYVSVGYVSGTTGYATLYIGTAP